MNSSPDIKLFLIGNKADLEDIRVVSKEQGERCKGEYEFDYFIETSALTGMNAQDIFVEAARVLYENYKLYKNEKKNKDNAINAKLNDIKEKKKKKCC